MSSSATAAFTDPVGLLLLQGGLSRITAIEYFLHPLNPFKSKNETTNEKLARNNFSIAMLIERGSDDCPGPMTLAQAEDKYRSTLSREKGEQYDLLPPPPQARGAPPIDILTEPYRLFTIRHIHRSSPTTSTALGIYYVLDGVIYKSPSVRSLLKATVSRTIQGLEDACDALSGCAWYEPGTGYAWNFEAGGKQNPDGVDGEEEDEVDILNQMRMGRRKRMRRVLDNRRPGERTEEEEEGIRAKEKINAILLRLRNRPLALVT